MKALILSAFTILVSVAAYAGPSVSGGVPPHPAISTMKLEQPIAGVDYPTDAPTSISSVLVFHKKRIPIFKANARLDVARAGIDFPTDSPPPVWADFQSVLELKKHTRIPVRLSLQSETLIWRLSDSRELDVMNIVLIERAEAGIDYPTDGPPGLHRDFYVAVMIDGSREPMN